MTQWQVGLWLANEVAEVGGVIAGSVQRARPTAGPDAFRGVVVSVRYDITGKGAPDGREVVRARADADDGGGLDCRFELPIPPDAPVSYNGRLLWVEWQVRLFIDLRRRPDEQLERRVLVVPQGGLERYRGPHPLTG